MAHPLLSITGLTFGTFNSRFKIGGAAKRETEQYLRMYHGDCWQNGIGYIGPMPSANDPNYDTIMENISRIFGKGFRNVTKECTDRAVDGLLSRSPDWKISSEEQIQARSERVAAQRQQLAARINNSNTQIDQLSQRTPAPSLVQPNNNINNVNISDPEEAQDDPEGIQQRQPDIDQRIVEAERMLGQMWQYARLAEVLKLATTRRLTSGRTYIRVYIPKKYLKGGTVQAKDLIEASKYIRAEVVEFDHGMVLDQDGEKLSMVKIERRSPYGNTNAQIRFIEISFVHDNGMTYIATVDETSQSKVKQLQNQVNAPKGQVTPAGTENEYSTSNPYPSSDEILSALQEIGADISDPIWLDENLTTEDMCGDKLLTEQFVHSNKALNLGLSMGVSALVEGGFPELSLTNVELQTEEVSDGKGGTMKVPKQLKRGGGVVANFVGIRTIDENGTEKYADPTVNYHDPTSMTTFADGKDLYYKACLEEVAQLFVITTGDGSIAAESRIQSRMDFVNRAKRFKPDLDRVGTWLMRTMIHYAAAAAGKNEYFKGINIDFDCKVSAGDLSAQERQVVINQYGAGLLSRESAIVLLGSEEPLIEIDKIRAEEAEKMVNQVNRMSAFSAMGVQNDPNADPNAADGGKGTPSNPRGYPQNANKNLPQNK